jgi:hypothetical protein
MSSKPKEWNEKVDITWREYFNPPWMQPHIGIVRLARRLEQELGKEKAHEIIKEVASELAYEYTKEKTAGIEVKSMDDFGKAMDLVQGKIMKVGSGKASEGYCLWAETWKKFEAADIGYLWCWNADEAIMRALNPKIKFTQGETLMTGNSFCDNNITWEEN